VPLERSLIILELKLRDITLKEYKLQDGTTLEIGRHPENDIVLEDKSVSRHHASFTGKQKKCYVTDKGSTNGTVANGLKIRSAQLKHGDVIQIGTNHTIRVCIIPSKKRQSTITGEHDSGTSTPTAPDRKAA
jgi:pSer/pThr/pTyr-binding forkhead associated (FHA) protein